MKSVGEEGGRCVQGWGNRVTASLPSALSEPFNLSIFYFPPIIFYIFPGILTVRSSVSLELGSWLYESVHAVGSCFVALV